MALNAAFMAASQGVPLSMGLLRDAIRGEWRKLGTDLDGDVSVGWWSKDGRTYMVVSDRPRGPALDQVVAYVRANIQ